MQKPKMEKGTEGQEEEIGFQNGKSRRMILFCLRRALPFKSQAFGWRGEETVLMSPIMSQIHHVSVNPGQ